MNIENIMPSESPQRPHSLWFYLSEISKIAKFILTESKLIVAYNCLG